MQQHQATVTKSWDLTACAGAQQQQTVRATTVSTVSKVNGTDSHTGKGTHKMPGGCDAHIHYDLAAP